MSQKSRINLKEDFSSGSFITEDKFADLIDSSFNTNDDSVLYGPLGLTGTNGLVGPAGATHYNGLVGPDGATHYIGLWMDFLSPAPTGPSSIGEPGQTIYVDGPSGPYLYICINENTWIKVSVEDTF
jgi:hypothetical protein